MVKQARFQSKEIDEHLNLSRKILRLHFSCKISGALNMKQKFSFSGKNFNSRRRGGGAQ